MTVKDLIKELEELPSDLPVVNDFQEINTINVEGLYYLTNSVDKYTYSTAVVLG